MHTSKQRQRLLTMTLTLALLLTLFPLRVWADEPSGGPDGRPETGQVTAALTQEMGVYLKLTIAGPHRYAEGITAIRRQTADGRTEVLRPISYRPALSGLTYYLDAAGGAVYFDGMAPFLRSGDVLILSSTQYQDLYLKITREDGRYQAAAVDNTVPPGDGMVLHVRLTGAFEPALAGQQGYDAITGATSTVSVNKNSSVEVQCALVKADAEPADSDWMPLYKSGLSFTQDAVKVELSPQGSGMTGVYSSLDSAVTLSGTPAMKGQYQVTVTVTDEQGRKAVSNPLPFLVYGGDEKLIDQLTLDHAVRAQDGKYLYDMVPWAIRTFGGENETVTVPAGIKAWFGSHTSGTYGRLGYAVANDQQPVQALIIPEGCDLTLVNMDVLSSVKLVVCSGARLTLRDSVVQGVVEVEKGGVFSMNYDARQAKFLTGASINGQLRLQSGAVVENAAIYSNTNFIANGNEARKNTRPVVEVLGDAMVKGQVFIRGDEAPTGADPMTGKSYSGQTGLAVCGGTLTLADGALLAVYGGGMQAATSVGGDAIRLDKGTITGSGVLAAVGGDGTFDRGGHAVSGSGTISVAKAYLQGGASAFPKSADITGGKAAADGVSAPGAVKRDGAVFRGEGENQPIPRWSGPSSAPGQADVDQLIAYIGPGQSDKTEAPVPVARTVQYNITTGKTEHGTLKVSTSRAPRERTITVTVQPEDGYMLDALKVLNQAGKAVKVKEKGENKFIFSMPASPVKVTAEFKMQAGKPVTPAAPEPKPEQPAAEKELSFRDVKQSDYFYDAVQWAARQKITQGTAENTFSPDLQCTRAQAITFLWRAAGSPAPQNRSLPFQDIKPGDFCYDAVCWAVERGITGGTSAKAFSPDAQVTRSQIAAFLHRAAGSPAARSGAAFSDVDGGSYYAAAVGWAVEHGITQGTGGGRFSPELACTRSQMVSLLYRSVQQNVFSW